MQTLFMEKDGDLEKLDGPIEFNVKILRKKYLQGLIIRKNITHLGQNLATIYRYIFIMLRII